jgi:LAO/AO transport system kinase
MMIETKPAGLEGAWKPPVLATVAVEGEGVTALTCEIARHRDYLVESGLLTLKTAQRMKAELFSILSLRVTDAAERALEDGGIASELVERMVARELDPHTAAEELSKKLEL